MDGEKWVSDGDRITDEHVLARLRRVLDEESPLIVEHRFYRGSRAPCRFVVDDFQQLEKYLREDARPGDAFYMWRFEECCREDNVAETGKLPDKSGRVPVGGPY